MTKRIFAIILLSFLLFSFLPGCDSSTSNEPSTPTEIICEIEQFANISGETLISKLGYPDDISSTTTNGYAEFPCVYYDYNDAKELGEVSFILINNEVVKLVSYNTYPYSKGKVLLESFGVTMGEDGAKEETDTYSRFRCPTEKVDDIWVTNVDSTTSTFGTLQVTYDMFYFEEFYLPMDTIEQSDYQWYTMETVKELLKAPNTADFPNILEWSFWKNPFYVGVKSYVDAQNSLGAEVRSEFFFIYKTDTSEIVYATFDNEVIANNDYIKTEELVSQLIDGEKTESALSPEVSNTKPTTEAKTEAQTNSKPNKPTNTTKPHNTTNSMQQENQVVTEKPNTDNFDEESETNSINELEYIVYGVCDKYNSGDTPYDGQIYATVDSRTSVTIEHRVGEWSLVPLSEEDKIYAMEDTLLDFFVNELNDLFPESIEVSIFTNAYFYDDSTDVPTDEGELDLDGIVDYIENEYNSTNSDWISENDLIDYGYSVAWMGDYIWLSYTDWNTNTTQEYIITGSPTSRFESGKTYTGNYNGYSIDFKYSDNSYEGILFYYYDLIVAGIL